MIKCKILRWESDVDSIEIGSTSSKTLTGKHAGKRPLGTTWRRCKDNIRVDLKSIYFNSMIWVDSDQDRDYRRALVNAALNLSISQAMESI